MWIKPLNLASIGSTQGKLAQVDDKLGKYAFQVLNSINNGKPLRLNQSLKLEATSELLPLVHKIVEIAYRDFGSGRVVVDLKEPELEDLKAKYRIAEDFDYKRERDIELRRTNAAVLTLDTPIATYMRAGLTAQETKSAMSSINTFVPHNVQQKLDIDPEEVLRGCLDYRDGQPLAITAVREHLPQVLKLFEWAYEHGTKLVVLNIEENKEFDLETPFYKYASDHVLTDVPNSVVNAMKERVEKNTARLSLMGFDPDLHAGIDPSRMQKSQAAVMEAIKEYRSRSLSENPWCAYYLPSTISARAAGYNSLYEAAVEARKINRTGQLEEHIARLTHVTEKVNALVKEGYSNFHFVSVKPETEIPDRVTDLKVGLTPKSFFVSCGLETPRGQKFIANVPSEETFTTPDWTKTEGTVVATRPVSINGNTIEGAKFTFQNGKVVNASATKNESVLLEWLKEQRNAGKLGEVALVAGSPIFDLGRVFNSILLDENATCHIAFGDAYDFCIEGANKFTNPDQKREYLESLNCNESTTHVDFMIGGPNVMVYAEKDTGEKRLLIKDNKFQI